MKVGFTRQGWTDYLAWSSDDATVLARLNSLIEECRRTPFKGRGKPEPLRGEFTGWWSRRVTEEHRLVYRVSGAGDSQAIEIAQCRLHY